MPLTPSADTATLTSASAPIRAAHAEQWMTLTEASRRLGITPSTLRRWGDEGRIAMFTTPGGHRRFLRSTIDHLIPPATAQRPALDRLGASPDRMTRAYRRAQGTNSSPEPGWMHHLTEADRAAFRELGREMVGALIAHLDAVVAAQAREALDRARALATQEGTRAARAGATLSDAVAGFLKFRAPFIGELAAITSRRGLDGRQATALMMRAETALDVLLMELMRGHAGAAAAADASAEAVSP